MRVLVTRPQPAASRTAAELRRRGHEPLVLPLAVAEHHTVALAEALAQPHAGIAVTSAEAIRALGTIGPLPPPLFEETLFAVGESTASAAAKLGFRRVIAGDNDGTTLARMIVHHGPTQGEAVPLLYLAGKPRSPGFEAALGEFGKPVTVCECYHMRPRALTAAEIAETIGRDPVDAVLLYSSESARRLFDPPVSELLSERLSSARMLCLSEKIATALPAQFLAKAKAAPSPNEASLLSLL